MPIYEYRCQECGELSEVMQRVSDPPLAGCPACGGEVRKLISAPAFQFKGSGWYATDYARKGSAPEAPSEDKAKDSGTQADQKDKPAAKGAESKASGPST